MAWQFGPGPYYYDPNMTPVPQGGRSPAPFSPRPVQANGNLPDPMWRGWVNNPAAQPQIGGPGASLPGGGNSLVPYKSPGPLIDNLGVNGGQGVIRTMARGALGKALGPLGALLGSTTPANQGEQDIYKRNPDGSVSMTDYGKNITSGGDMPLHNGFGPVVPFMQSPMGKFFSSIGHNMVGAARDNAGLPPDPSLEGGNASASSAPANASAVPQGAMAAAFNTLGGPPNASPVPPGAMSAALAQVGGGSVPLPQSRPAIPAVPSAQAAKPFVDPDLSFYNGPGSSSFGAMPQAAGLQSPAQNLNNGFLSKLFKF